MPRQLEQIPLPVSGQVGWRLEALIGWGIELLKADSVLSVALVFQTHMPVIFIEAPQTNRACVCLYERK